MVGLLVRIFVPAEQLFVAVPFTVEHSFTVGVEGPNCDASGNVYAVNFEKQQTIGKVTPDGKAELWLTLPGISTGNGIVFDGGGTMFLADYTGHNILKIDPKTKKIEVYCHEPRMHQPNDLAITKDGTLYASDPNWPAKTGQVWRIDKQRNATIVAPNMGTANGIEVSPDGKWLYVNESIQRNVWKFRIKGDGTLDDKQLIRNFRDGSFDGMRCDVEGNLYISRTELGKIIKMTPAGKVLNEVDVLGSGPTNLCFGGPDGRTGLGRGAGPPRCLAPGGGGSRHMGTGGLPGHGPGGRGAGAVGAALPVGMGGSNRR